MNLDDLPERYKEDTHRFCRGTMVALVLSALLYSGLCILIGVIR